jgi:ribose-phosphate pyrophosphokinase
MREPLKIFSGTSNLPLAKEICEIIGIDLGDMEISRFKDGEIYVQIKENVRATDVFVIQSTCHPGNDNLMELLIMIDAFKRASADRITAVIPYYGYARQDRKDKPRVPITSRLVADLLTAAGASRILTMELHAQQIVGFFNIPVDQLKAKPVMLESIKALNIPDLIIVAPDAGAVERAREYADKLDTDIAIMDKKRDEANKADILHVIGDVKDKNAFLVDDMVDTGGTLIKSAHALIEKGAKSIYAACPHPVLSDNAVKNIEDSPIEKLIVSNTIPLSKEKANSKKIIVKSVANLFAAAIQNIHEGKSVSSLFI